MCARIVWPFSSSTEKVVLGKICLIVPNNSNGGSLLSSTLTGDGLFGRFPEIFRLRMVHRFLDVGACSMARREGRRQTERWVRGGR